MTGRFLDTFQPRVLQASPLFNRAGPLISQYPTSSLGFPNYGSNNFSRKQEQVRHFTFWTYVCIKRIADKFSESFPNAGIPTGNTMPPARATRPQMMSVREKEFIIRTYGSRVIQSVTDSIDPLELDHPFIQLLRRVNGTGGLAEQYLSDTWSEFAFESVMFLYLTGCVYWWIVPDLTGKPVEMWVIPSHWVTDEVFDKSGRLSHIVVRNGSSEIEVPANEVIKYQFKSPISKLDGFSPLMAAPQWIDNMASIAKSQYYAFERGINPDMIVQLGQMFANPDANALRRLKEKWISRIEGVQASGEPLFFPPEEQVQKWERWSHAPKEMSFMDSSTIVRDQVLSLFGVPKAIAGIVEDVNRNSFEGSLVSFAELTMNPLFRRFAGLLTEKLAPRFDPEIRVWYSDVAPRNNEQVMKEQQFAARWGAIDPDEIRVAQGREAKGTPDMQTGWMPAGVMPSSTLYERTKKEAELIGKEPKGEQNPPGSNGKVPPKEKPNEEGESAKKGEQGFALNRVF